MKFCTVYLALGLILLATIGCDRQDPADENPVAFDPNLDPAARLISVETDPDIMENQVEISQRAAAGKSTRRTTPAVDAGTDAAAKDPVEIVKEKLAEAIAAINAGDHEKYLELFDSEAAEMMRPHVVLPKQLANKAAQLEELASNALGIELPADTKSAIADKTGGETPATVLAWHSIDEYQIQADGENVIMTDPRGGEMTFVPSNGDYRITELNVPPEVQLIFDLKIRLYNAQIAFADELILGLESGDITIDNFEVKAFQLYEQTAGPVIAEYMRMQNSPDETTAQPDLAPDKAPDDETADDEAPANQPAGGGLFRNINPDTRDLPK